MILSIAVSISAFIIVLSTNIILYYYSSSLKRISLIGNAAVSFCTGLAFIFGGIAVGYVENSFLPAIFAFLINIIREIIKDIQDIEGDSLHNHQTLPVKSGITSTKKLLSLFIILLVCVTVYPFLTELYKIEYLIVVLFFVDLPLIYMLKEIYSKEFFTKLSLISFKLKALMIVGLFAIFLGRF
jgi:geranylgeranylglycerol-phosphate geranylgeranyltransferase